MKNLFGGGSKKPKQTDQNAVEKSKDELTKQIEELEAKIDFEGKKADELQNQAKAMLKKGNKEGAKKLLAKKKRIEANIKQWEGASAMMEEQKMMLENADTMKNIYSTLSKINLVFLYK